MYVFVIRDKLTNLWLGHRLNLTTPDEALLFNSKKEAEDTIKKTLIRHRLSIIHMKNAGFHIYNELTQSASYRKMVELVVERYRIVLDEE